MGVKKKWGYKKNHKKKVGVKMKVGVKKSGGGECAKRNQFNKHAICRWNYQHGMGGNSHDLIRRGYGFEFRNLQIFEVEKKKFHFAE